MTATTCLSILAGIVAALAATAAAAETVTMIVNGQLVVCIVNGSSIICL